TAFFTFNSQTYFIANSNGFASGYRLYSTDGTAANTQGVAYVHKAAPVTFQNELFFLKGDSNLAWVSLTRWDGTGTGFDFPTETFTDFQVKADGPRVVIGGKLYFHGRETDNSPTESLWVMDGAYQATTLVHASYQLLGGSNGKAWFIDSNDKNLLRTDGSATEIVVDLPSK